MSDLTEGIGKLYDLAKNSGDRILILENGVCP